jgi:hypothetical protein
MTILSDYMTGYNNGWADGVKDFKRKVPANPVAPTRTHGVDERLVAIYQVMLGDEKDGDWTDVHPKVFEQTPVHRQRIVYAKNDFPL